MNDTITPDSKLDATGLMCPMPVLRTKKALRPLVSGQVLEVLASDPASQNDIHSFCDMTGDELLSSEALDEETFRYLIRKK